jgi:hypothetical protein
LQLSSGVENPSPFKESRLVPIRSTWDEGLIRPRCIIDVGRDILKLDTETRMQVIGPFGNRGEVGDGRLRRCE